MNLHVLVADGEQLKAALDRPEVSRIYGEAEAFGPKERDLVLTAGKECGIALPYVFRDVTYLDVGDYDCVLIRSLDELGAYRQCGKPLVADYGVYAMNDVAAGWLEEQGVAELTAPVELNEKELRQLGLQEKELIVYGYLPMMVSAQCIRKNRAGCDKKPSLCFITDRTGRRLPVRNVCPYCYNLIYNPVPLSLLGIMNQVRRLEPRAIRLNFTIESGAETARILETMADPAEYTRGHYTRGVE